MAESSAGSGFQLRNVPLLSRVGADRSDHLRTDIDAAIAGWADAAVLRVDPRGQVLIADGQVVFNTTDPDVDWKGTYLDTNDPLPDGVYYYLCLVTFTRLAGDELIELKGYVHIQGSGARGNVN